MTPQPTISPTRMSSVAGAALLGSGLVWVSVAVVRFMGGTPHGSAPRVGVLLLLGSAQDGSLSGPTADSSATDSALSRCGRCVAREGQEHRCSPAWVSPPHGWPSRCRPHRGRRASQSSGWYTPVSPLFSAPAGPSWWLEIPSDPARSDEDPRHPRKPDRNWTSRSVFCKCGETVARRASRPRGRVLSDASLVAAP